MQSEVAPYISHGGTARWRGCHGDVGRDSLPGGHLEHRGLFKQPRGQCGDFGSNLDQLTTVDAKYKLPVYAPTFADSVNQLTSITDRISLQEQRYVGVIDKVSYRLNQIEDSVTRVVTPPRTSVKSIINPNPQATNKAIATLAWPIRASIGQLRNTLNDVVKKILQTGQKIIFYRVPSPVTLAGVSVSTGAGIVDLMNLNPSLVGQPFLQTGTMVRYYSGAIR